MNKAGDLPLTAQTLACHFIGNEWVRSADGRTLPVIDPATGEIFAEIARGGPQDIDAAVRAARHAFEGEWGNLAPAERDCVTCHATTALGGAGLDPHPPGWLSRCGEHLRASSRACAACHDDLPALADRCR